MMASLPFNYKVYEKKNKLYVVINYKSEDGKYKKKCQVTGYKTDRYSGLL